jgi:sugar phosphate isomerase/epimerase
MSTMTRGFGTDLQCSTGPFWAFGLEDALDAVAEAGFSSVELMVTRDPRTQEPEPVTRLTAERGLAVAAVHAPFLVLTRGVWGFNPQVKTQRGVEMCRALGATTLIVHPPLVWEQSYARWLVSDAACFEGVTVAVENMYPTWVAGRALRGYRWTNPRDLAAAAHYVALDLSHLAVARHDALAAYALLHPKVAHIHLSNNAGNRRDGHLPLDSGVVPVDRLLAEMRRTHYSGGVSLELSVHRYLERPKDLVAVLRRNREYVASRWPSPRRLTKELGS